MGLYKKKHPVIKNKRIIIVVPYAFMLTCITLFYHMHATEKNTCMIRNLYPMR